MEGEEERTDFWGELREEEGSKAEGPLAAEQQGSQQPHPAMEGVHVGLGRRLPLLVHSKVVAVKSCLD